MSFGVRNLFPSTQNQVRIPAFVGMKSYQIPKLRHMKSREFFLGFASFSWGISLLLTCNSLQRSKFLPALKILGFRGYLLYVTRAQSKTERQLELKVQIFFAFDTKKTEFSPLTVSETRLISVETTWRLGPKFCWLKRQWTSTKDSSVGGGGWCAEQTGPAGWEHWPLPVKQTWVEPHNDS